MKSITEKAALYESVGEVHKVTMKRTSERCEYEDTQPTHQCRVSVEGCADCEERIT